MRKNESLFATLFLAHAEGQKDVFCFVKADKRYWVGEAVGHEIKKVCEGFEILTGIYGERKYDIYRNR